MSEYEEPRAVLSGTVSRLLDVLKQQADEIAALRECLRECADDLASSLIDQYGGDIRHPVQRRRWERDMEPVERARKLLGDK